MALIHEQHGTITPVSGTGTATLRLDQSVLHTIIVTSTTSTTTFDVAITNSQNYEPIKRENMTGEFVEERQTPFRGYATLSITNASADEEFQYYAGFIERYA